jgi:hypothetical protein
MHRSHIALFKAHDGSNSLIQPGESFHPLELLKAIACGAAVARKNSMLDITSSF